MNLNEINQAMQSWNDAKHDAALLKTLFNLGNGFEINFSEMGLSASGSIHVYPGIFNDSIVYFSISSEFDTQEQYDSTEGISPYIVASDLIELEELQTSSLFSDPIITNEAIFRINEWEENKDKWIDNATSSDLVGVYQAFKVPLIDLSATNNGEAYLALVDKPNENYLPDLIIQDIKKGHVLPGFFDTVRPMPPFDDQASFFLLSFVN